MNHVCVLLHGSNEHPKDVSWVEQLALIIQPKAQSIQFIPRKYNYIMKAPLLIPKFRERIIEEQRKYFNKLYEIVGRQTKISVVAHSFGVHQVLELLPDFKFYNLVFLMGVGDQHFNWNDYELNFNRVLNYWSPVDTEVKRCPFGKIGQTGHINRHPRVDGVRTRWTHDSFRFDLQNLAEWWTKSGGIFNR